MNEMNLFPLLQPPALFFNKTTQLDKKKNNTADALFISDSSHIIEHVQNGLKMSIHSTTTGRPTIQSFAV